MPLFGIYELKNASTCHAFIELPVCRKSCREIKESDKTGLPLRSLGCCRMRNDANLDEPEKKY
jgi:hypothetical protein